MSRLILRCSLVGLILATAACDPVKPDSGQDASTCLQSECTASCQAQGRSGGYCTGTGCLCAAPGDDAALPGTTVSGKVWSPGKVVPISGALVWFADAEPAPIPAGAYPETCTTPNGPHFLSRPDGTFDLQVAAGTYWLVVQKGQFRRVRQLEVPAQGPYLVDEVNTTLPNRTSQGDTIPRIALVYALGPGDHIEDVLAKIGMGDVVGNRLDLGTEPFDIYNLDDGEHVYPANTELLESLDVMKSYHIIFFPCTIAGYPQIGDPTGPLANPAVLENIRQYLNAGGKIYATDMMYDIFEQPMPEYVDMCGDDAVINAGDQEAWNHTETAGGWTSYGQAEDPDLAAWLEAIGVGSTNLAFLENFVWIESMYTEPEPTPGPPDEPKVWVSGDFILEAARTMPLTITFPYNAGKVLFSTYHTVSGSPQAALIPQEYVLLYLIMEIGVCQNPVE
jgi:hypothetical protein